MDSSGKVLTIFVVIIAILLISLTAISLFFFQKETDRRKLAEVTLEELRSEKAGLEESLKEAKKQNFLLQEKHKEADARINDLSDELDLEKGLREEIRLETVDLKKQIEEAEAFKETFADDLQAKEELQEKLKSELSASEQKIKELEERLRVERERGQELGRLYEQKQAEVARLEDARDFRSTSSFQPANVSDEGFDKDISAPGIELGEIIVIPDEEIGAWRNNVPLRETVSVLDKALEGRILSVDAETEFVIVSLGEADGVKIGNVLSVYRGDSYVGDIRVTRLQPEMSAADLIPPFSIRSVKKNDQVKIK